VNLSLKISWIYIAFLEEIRFRGGLPSDILLALLFFKPTAVTMVWFKLFFI